MKYVLWILQILLALLFVFAGVVKLVFLGNRWHRRCLFPCPFFCFGSLQWPNSRERPV